MDWLSFWDRFFGTTEMLGLDMGFWVSMAFVVLIVIAMNVVFWSMKPLKRSKSQAEFNN